MEGKNGNSIFGKMSDFHVEIIRKTPFFGDVKNIKINVNIFLFINFYFYINGELQAQHREADR